MDARSNQNIFSLLSLPTAWKSSGPLFRRWPAVLSTALRTSAILARRWWRQQRWSQTEWRRTPRRSTCWLRWLTSSRGSLWPANTPSCHLHAGQNSTLLPHLLQGSPHCLQKWSANLPHPTHATSHPPLLLPAPPRLRPRLSVPVQTVSWHLRVQNEWTEAPKGRWWPLVPLTGQVVVMDSWGSTMEQFLDFLWRIKKTVTVQAAWQPRRRKRISRQKPSCLLSLSALALKTLKVTKIPPLL